MPCTMAVVRTCLCLSVIAALASARSVGSEVIKGPTTGLIPLTELGLALYKGYNGGLYGDGNNSPPQVHQAATLMQAGLIQPLDRSGRPSPEGKIGLISLGMSNTTQEFSQFKTMADADPNKSGAVVIVDCAQGGQAAHDWAYADPNSYRNPWLVMDRRINQAGLDPNQVQVVWIKQAQKGPGSIGPFPIHTQSLRDDLIVILQLLRQRFCNLRIAYLSSRIYAGYAQTELNPEPYAYESAFAVRWVIELQINGDPRLNYDPNLGPVLAPIVLWGPYLWADGLRPRLSDGLVWLREDFGADGTHPSSSGRQKVAGMLLEFFKTDPTARRWFTRAVPRPVLGIATAGASYNDK